MKIKEIVSSRTFLLAYRLLGKQVLFLIALSLLLSLAVFFIELLMAFSIQRFFVSLGLLTTETNDHWLSGLLPLNGTLYSAIFLLLCVGSLRAFLNWAQYHFSSLITVEFETLVRQKLAKWAFVNRETKLDELTNLFNDKTIGAGNFVSSVISAVSRIIVSALLLITLFRMEAEVTIASLLLLSVLFIPSRLISSGIQKVSDIVHLELANSISRLLEGVKNSLLLHIYGLNKREYQKTSFHLNHYLTSYRKYHVLAGLKNMLPQLIGLWLLCLITLISVSRESLDSGQLIEYFYIFMRFVQSLGELMNLSSYISLTLPRFKAIWKWWSTENKIDTKILDETYDNNPIGERLGWKISNLEFGYNDKDTLIFENLNLQINPGTTLVITGQSGSGKSTLLSILLGLNIPTRGGVQVFSEKGEFDLSDVRGRILPNIGYVGPESFTIPGTIKENLQFTAAKQNSDSELYEALNLANCAFVSRLDKGLEHGLTEQGEGLSAGQKQRLALARALLRKPNVLILDEATSNLDIHSEESLVKTFEQLKGKVTIIAVTHREALLRIADQHIDLDESKIRKNEKT